MPRLATLALLFTVAAHAADDLPSAARELARRTAAFLGGRVPAETWRNRSGLPDSELDRARREFRAALPAPDLTSNGSSEIRLTLSENASQYLLIEEARADEESQTWIVSWSRTTPSASLPPALTLDRKLIWEQDEPILDLAVWGVGKEDTGLLVLSPSRLSFYERQGTQWSLQRQIALPLPKIWPRDPRARLRRTGSRIEIFLPGAVCQGDTGASFSLDCQPSSDPWVLDSGNRSLLLAYFTSGRNYFDGRVVLQEGNRKTVPPFYSAAALEQPGGTSWLLALTDGQTQLFNSAWDPVASIPNWGSDLVTLNTCAANPQILATKRGDNSQPDALQAFSIVNGSALPASAPLPFAGAITAFWPASPSSALAVAFDATAHKYRAYAVTLSCGS